MSSSFHSNNFHTNSVAELYRLCAPSSEEKFQPGGPYMDCAVVVVIFLQSIGNSLLTIFDEFSFR